MVASRTGGILDDESAVTSGSYAQATAVRLAEDRFGQDVAGLSETLADPSTEGRLLLLAWLVAWAVVGFSIMPYITVSPARWLMRAVTDMSTDEFVAAVAGLMLGLFTQVASVAGAILLAFYYVASPPLLGMDIGIPVEGHYLIVNKNLIELLALVLKNGGGLVLMDAEIEERKDPVLGKSCVHWRPNATNAVPDCAQWAERKVGYELIRVQGGTVWNLIP